MAPLEAIPTSVQRSSSWTEGFSTATSWGRVLRMATLPPLPLARAFVATSAAVFTGIGLWTLIDPVGALEQVGVTATSPGGVLELRAMYGGLELGMATFLLWCLRTPSTTWAGVMGATLTIGGLGLVRLVGLLTVHTTEPLLPILCAAEGVAGGLGAVLMAYGRASTSAGSSTIGSPP